MAGVGFPQGARRRYTHDNKFWECGVSYHEEVKIKTGFFKSEKRSFATIFFAPYIFTDRDSALYYFKTFLNTLIKEGTIPGDSIVDNKINENIIMPLVRQVEVAAIEPEHIEYEGRSDIPL